MKHLALLITFFCFSCFGLQTKAQVAKNRQTQNNQQQETIASFDEFSQFENQTVKRATVFPTLRQIQNAKEKMTVLKNKMLSKPHTLLRFESDKSLSLKLNASGQLVLMDKFGKQITAKMPNTSSKIVVVQGNEYDNTLTISKSIIDAGFDVLYLGDTQKTTKGDLLVVGDANDTFNKIEVTHYNANDGVLKFDNKSTITFVGLEPLVLSGTAADLIINLPTTANPDVVLQNSGAAGQSEITGSTFESTAFSNPTNSLTLNGGTAQDDISIEGLDAAFDANLTINTNAGDNVTFQTNATNITSGDLNLSSGTLTISADITTTGAITTTTTDNTFINNGATVQTANSDISITGGTSPTTGLNFDGVGIDTGIVQTTGSGNIALNGTGGNDGASDGYRGIDIYNSGTVQATGTGSIALTGMGSNGNSQNRGIFCRNSAVIAATSGTITLNGTGDGIGSFNIGVDVTSSATITTTTGNISLIGTAASNGASNSDGIRMTGGSTLIQTVDGTIDLNGVGGGTATSTGNFHTGVTIIGGAGITATGSGSINITGQGASSIDSANRGIEMGSSSSLHINGGSLTLHGTAGSGNLQNHGVVILANSTLEDFGNGTISITGIGGTGTGNVQYGTFLSTGVSIVSNGGIIILDGTAGPSTTSNLQGTRLTDSSIMNSGSGTITITGIGGDGTNNNMGFFHSGTSTISTENGDISINGSCIDATGSNNHGIRIDAPINTTGSGNIIFTGNTVNPDGAAINLFNSAAVITAGGTITATSTNGPIFTPSGVTGVAQFDATSTTANGYLAPGQSPGQLIINGDFNIGSGDTLEMEFDGFTTAGTDYDQLVVNGAVNITDATLVLVDNTGAAEDSCATLILIDNDGTDPIVGTFNGLAEGDSVSFGAITAKVTYVGGDGNDFALIMDDTPPTAVCQNITLQLDTSGNATITTSNVDGGSTDNCGIAALTIDVDTFDCGDVGTNQVVLTVTDVNGNSSQCTAIVTVQDVTAPVITCPADISVSNDAGLCSADVTVPQPTIVDNCLEQTVQEDDLESYPLGSIHGLDAHWVGWSGAPSEAGEVSNEQALSGTQSLKITGIASGGPVDQLYLLGNRTQGVWEVSYNLYIPSGNTAYTNFQKSETPGTEWAHQIQYDSDGTGNYQVNSTLTPFSFPNDTWFEVVHRIDQYNDLTEVFINGVSIITHPYTWQAFGNSGINQLGAIDFFPVTNGLGTDPNPSAIPLFYVDNVTLKSVAWATNDYNNTSDASDTYPVGSTVITWSVTDAGGNTATCTHTVTVNDTEPPVITCPGDITTNNDLGVCGAIVTYNLPIVTENCAEIAGFTSLGSYQGHQYYLSNSSFTGANAFANAISNGGFVATVNDAAENTFIRNAVDAVAGTIQVLNGFNDVATEGTFVWQSGEAVTFTNWGGGEPNNAGNEDYAVIRGDGLWNDIRGNVSRQYILEVSLIPTQTTGLSSGSEFPVGTTTNTFEYTDPSGNTASCSFDVTVIDAEAPTITCPGNITVDNDPGVCGAAVTYTISANDNCDFPPMTLSGFTFLGIIDGHTYYLSDATFTADAAFNDAIAQGGFVATISSAEANDLLNSQIGFQRSWIGFNDVATEGTFVWQDGSPVVYTNWAAGQPNNGGNEDYTLLRENGLWHDYPVTDSYKYVLQLTGGLEQTAGLPSGSTFPVGTTTNTFLVTDTSGNTATCSFDVTVNDTELPVITCPGDITVANDPGICGATVTYAVTTSDNCPGETLLQTAGLASGSVFPVGTTTNTFEVTDASGNTASCSFNVTVNDTEPPVANCAAPFTVQLDASGNATISVTDIDNGSTDNCGIASLSIDPSSFTCADVGPNTVTLTVTDVNGNTSTCTTIVTVEDNVPPVAVCMDIIVQLDANGEATITGADVDGGSTDNCGIASLDVSPNTFTCADVGLNTVTLTVTDVNGNSSTCTATVTVEDSVPPVAVCMDITVQLDANGEATITGADVDGGSTDACGIASLDVSPNMFDCSNVGPNTVTLTVTDVNGNSSTCTATVTVEDSVPPVIACPMDISVSTDPGICGAEVFFADAVALDACGIDTVIQTQGPPSGSTFPVGDTLIEFTATDVNGNSTACTFTVTVADDDAPTAVCQDITVQLDANGQATITAGDIDGGSFDNCAIDTISASPTSFDCSDVGDNPVTLTVTDIYGNSSTCTAIVTVEDNVAPAASCMDITVELDANGQATITGADVDGGSSDACGIASLEVSPDTFDCSNVGANTVTLTVTDVNGNVSTCTATVTVEDNTDPDLVCMDITLPLDENGQASITPADVIASNDDACGILTTGVDITDFDCGDIGTPIVVTVFSQDVNGNLSSCNATVTVVDDLPPVVECPGDQTVDPGANNLFYELPDYWAEGLATAADNCTDPVTVTSQDPAAGTLLPDGTYTVTLCAQDEYGNEACCTFQLTVESTLGSAGVDISTVVLYPNPARKVVYLSNPQAVPLVRLAIYDMTGRFVTEQDLADMGTQAEIDISRLSTATYMVIIEGQQGSLTKQLVKE